MAALPLAHVPGRLGSRVAPLQDAGQGRTAPGGPRAQAHGRLCGASPLGTVGKNTHLQTLWGRMRSLFLGVEFGGHACHRPAHLRLPRVMPVMVAGTAGGDGASSTSWSPPQGRTTLKFAF